MSYTLTTVIYLTKHPLTNTLQNTLLFYILFTTDTCHFIYVLILVHGVVIYVKNI